MITPKIEQDTRNGRKSVRTGNSNRFYNIYNSPVGNKKTGQVGNVKKYKKDLKQSHRTLTI